MVPYELSVDGVRALLVHEIRGREKLSEAWRFDVTVTTSADGPDVEQAALGARATLVLHTADSPRAFYGVVSAARLSEVLADGTLKYTLRVAPRLWLLRQKKRSRIFQRMRVPDIVATVLGEAGIGVQWQLVRPYPKREYCTQYEETDEHFVRRILAESGIFFYFFTGGPTEDAGAVATIAAAAGAATSVAGALGAPVPDAVSAAASLAAGLVPIPGDTIVCADDAVCYPGLGFDDAASLAAATAASLAMDAAETAGLPGAGLAGAATAAVVGALSSAPSLAYAPYDAGHAAHRDMIARFVLRNRVRPNGAAYRDYDPEKPLVRLQSVAVSTAPFPPSPAEVAAIAAATASNTLSAVSNSPLESALPAGVGAAVAVAGAVADVASTVLSASVPHEVYEHHGNYLFPRWDLAPDEAPLILRQKRRRASVADGESGNALMAPGHRFALTGHPAGQLDRTYVVLEVQHRGALRPEGGQRESYVNRFECAPAEMPYPPPRPKRRSVQVSLTATVVGPGGEEIHVDAKGRIKIQFHWDREGKQDGESSCWIRVMQPWAGAGWGVQFIPRVGMEVVVGFEGGDPDKPMVMGTLYNGTHPTPFTLPQDKTRSGWRTQTSPGGEGYNELSFEDGKGREQILLHAQRDLDEIVLNDHRTKVARDQSCEVGADRRDDVAGSAHHRVAKDRTEKIGENYALAIGESRKLSIFGSDQERVAGSRTTQVDKSHNVQVGGTYSLMVGTRQHPSTAEAYVWGHYAIGAEGPMVLTSYEGITLRCGDSVVEINEEGITIKGKKVAVEATTSATMKGNGPSLSLSDEATISAKTLSLVAKKASLVLEEDAKLDGKEIKLNCGGIDPQKLVSESGEPQTKKVSLNLVDADGKPHAGKEYVLTAGGARFEGTTDGSGKLELEVPKDAEAAQIVLYLGPRPEGPQIRYRVALEDMPPDSIRGVLTRLKNLGYYWGEPSESLDDLARDAIRAFQRANELEPTGEIDDLFKAALAKKHGH